MFKRAMVVLKNNQNSQGIGQSQVLKPKTLTHFHINAADDQVDFKSYG